MKLDLSKNDFYTQKAKNEGYPARSVYKLQEIDRKFNVFKESDSALDLGAAPGSWLLYISKKVGLKGRVIGVDIEDLKVNLPANSVFIKKNVFDDDFFDILIRCCHPEASSDEPKDLTRSVALSETKGLVESTKEILRLDASGRRLAPSIFNVVVSDLAPRTSGLHEKDVADCLDLAQRAFEIACQALEVGGDFVCKIFEGTDVDEFVREVEKNFKIVKRYRPQAVRRGSREFYLIAKNYEGEHTTGDHLAVE